MKSENFSHFRNTSYDPVSLGISAFIFNKVISHVDERKTQCVIFTCWFKFSIELSFSYLLGKVSIVFKHLNKLIYFFAHIPELIIGMLFFFFRQYSFGHHLQSVSHAIKWLRK